MDLAKVSIAVLVEQDGLRCTRARVAVGSVAPVPLRLRQTEELLEGATVDSATLTTAGDTARMRAKSPDDPLSTCSPGGTRSSRRARPGAADGGSPGRRR